MSALAAQRTAREDMGEGEYAFTHRNFEQIAQKLYHLSGIHLHEGKATLVYSRLAKRLRKLGLNDFDAYCALISSAEGEGEIPDFINALTTNLTKFFREPHHFDHLSKKVLPQLAAVARSGQRVRLWSAACSSGEEAYSMALCLFQAMPDAHRHDVKILATDIDQNMVATARVGRYSDEAVAPIPAALRERWMSCGEGDKPWRVKDDVRAVLAFNEMNLIGPWPMRGKFDVIFCRNVVIYFDDRTQTELWKRFRQALAPEGRLYVGHSERADEPGLQTDGLTVYKMAGAAR
ncbi:MAG: protein-glutamate O-methyltransferase [Hyphomonadaceae bacterium JAD_PAG50586_4]|nr:MAG: protein-glutamate O-methyltransferase [Hyphomonadaceae bacterium JAD_PAG50586_4]